jgi:hypothetical protein
MVTAGQNLFVHQGSNTEDNATKDLRWLLVNTPWPVAQEVLKPVFDQVDLSKELFESNMDDVSIRTQAKTADVGRKAEVTALIGLAPQGSEYEKITIDEFEPGAERKQSRRLDLVIDLEARVTIGIEAKVDDFNRAQLRDHARELEADVFGVVTWNGLREGLKAAEDNLEDGQSISDSPLAVPTIERLFEEYREFLRLKLVSLTETLGTSSWTAGENVIEMVRHVGKDKLKHRAVDLEEEPLPVPVALRFQSRPHDDPNGPSLYFSPEEWKQLVEDLDSGIIQEGFARGTTAPMQERYEESGGDYIPLAEISDSQGNSKYMRYGAPESRESNNPTVYLNKDTADGGNLSGDIPMYGNNEISEMFGSDSALTRLFTSPEIVFDSL